MRVQLLSMFVLSAAMACGAQLTPEQALKRFKGCENLATSKARSLNAGLRLSYTAETDGMNAYYVYNNGSNGGYVILSADDCAPALLGYSDRGTFDMANIPSNMKAWLDGYACQIAAASQTNAKSAEDAGNTEITRQTVEPMITTSWGQGEPYNDDCPELGGETALTGCVATAMAQLMNYHKWPQGEAKGDVEYTYYYDNKAYKISENMTDYTFKWDNMANVYNDGNATEKQEEAVAELMYACGVAVNMEYSPDGSGASDIKVPLALYRNFGYDKGIAYVKRNCYTSAQWDSLMYNELANGRPMYYSGGGNNNVHAFVCDGYDGNGYYHFNWGWSGSDNGYFLLDALTFSDSMSNYSVSSGAVIGIRPPVEGSEMLVNWFSPGFSIYDDGYSLENSLDRDGSVVFAAGDISSDKFVCATVDSMEIMFGLRLISESQDTLFIDCEEDVDDYLIGDSVASFTISGKDLPVGKYLGVPAVKDDKGNVYSIRMSLNTERFVYIEVTADSIFTTPSGMSPSLVAKLIGDVSTVRPDTTCEFNYEITNSRLSYNGDVSAYIEAVDDKGETTTIYSGTDSFVSVPAGETVTFKYRCTFSERNALPAGAKCYLVLYDENINAISEKHPVSIMIKSTPTGIDNISSDGVQAKVYSIDGRYVGTAKEALAPGMYISGGKKFIAK